MQPETAISNDGVNYKKKYKTLKRKLRMLIYEQECFAEELRKAQRKLLRISRDKSFLLDRLLQYEKPEHNMSDSEATASSDSDTEHQPTTKKRKVPAVTMSTSNNEVISAANINPFISQTIKGKTFQKPSPVALSMSTTPVTVTKETSAGKKKAKVPKKSVVKSGVKVASAAHTQIIAGASASANLFSKPQMVSLTSPGKQNIQIARSIIQSQGQTIAMTQEELERHLELKQSNKPQFMSIEKTPMLPDNIFNNENSNSCDFPDNKTTDDEDLVIDMP